MSKEHPDLTAAEDIHIPKGFSEASAETALTKSASGDLTWKLQSEIGGTGPAGPPGTVASLTVADLTNPVELNSQGIADIGGFVIIYEVDATERDKATWYFYDATASGVALDAPYVMATADGGSSRWIATAGEYQISAPTSAQDGSTWISTLEKESINATASTGIYTGGTLSVGAPNTTFSITDGSGFVVDNTTDPANPTITKVAWSGLSNIAVTNLATHLITFVSLDSGGSVIQQTTRWTASESRDCIVLGVIIHVDKTIVDAVNNEHHSVLDVSGQIGDVIEGLGFINLDGNVFSPNGVNTNLDKSAGIMMGHGINFYNDPKNPHQLALPSLPLLTFQYRYSDGSNGATTVNIDPANLDNGAGGLTALSTNKKWSIQRIYSFTSNNVKIQRGVTEYGSKEKAIAGIATEPFITEPSIAANGMLRGFIVCKQDTTDLSDSGQAVFIEASKFQTVGGASTGIASTLQSAYDNSSTPEMTTDITNGAVDYKQGTGAEVALHRFKDSSDVTKGTIATDEWKVETQAYSAANALSDVATVATDCSDGNVHTVTLAGNRTLGAPTNLKAGATYLWIITQDGTGSRTLAYNAVFKFPGGTAPELTTAAGSVDILSGVSDGTNVYCNLLGDFQ